jgi:phytanoyl-CoA hydroxylase
VEKLRQRYREQGYALLPGLFAPGELQAIRDAACRIVDEFDIDRQRTVFSTRNQQHAEERYFLDSAEAVHCFIEEGAVDAGGGLTRPKALAINKIGHALHDRVPEFRAFCRLPSIVGVLREIGYDPAMLWQTMYIFKQPRIGGEVRWHQDASYLRTRPSSVVGFWVAVEDATRENGCLWVQPGGHRSALREVYEVDHHSGRGMMKQLDGAPWPDTRQARAVEAPSGSLVIFHDHMPHYSSTNRSGKSRHAFTMHFARPDSAWPASNWLQRRQLPPFLV